MENNDKYSLLIKDINKELNNFDFSKLNKNFVYAITNDESEDSYVFDIVLDIRSLTLYHCYSKVIFMKLKNSNELFLNIEKIIIELNKTDFDKDLAIEMLGGSERAYSNIINNYYNEYSNINNDIFGLLAISDYDGIRKIVHKIKGVSLYLGSEKFLNLATELENHIFNKTANKTIVENFLIYHERLLNYLKRQVQNV